MIPVKEVSVFELAGDDVLSVVLNEQEAWLTLAEHGMSVAHMPTLEHRAALNAVVELRKAGKSVSDTTVMDRSGGVVNLNWISQRFALYDQTRTGQTFHDNIGIVMKHGLNQGVQRLLNEAIGQLKKGTGQTEKVMNELIGHLAAAQTSSEMKGENGREIGSDMRAFLNSEPPPVLSTGFEWLDQITGGYEKQMIWWIAGAYKGRKSTLLFLMALSLLTQNKDVMMLSREMPRRRVAANMISMLSVAYLLRKGWYALKADNGQPLNNISSIGLTQARNRYRTWDKRKVEAIDFAVAKWESFENHIRVYDTSTSGGSLNDWQSVERVFKRDQAKYGTPDVMFADYLQLFGAPSDKTYEKVAYLAAHFQALAQKENLTAVVAAQRNEESIKSGTSGYSAGIKGGGDPAQTADYLLLTSYKDGEADDSKLKVQMKLSRHGVGGKGVEEEYDIHPPSGLVLSCNWIKNLKV